jgi:hypothetical protein
MKFFDNGDRITVISDNRITFKNIKEDKIIKNNLIAIEKTQILQAVKDINKKFGRKLTRNEREKFLRKISSKINRKLISEDYDLINEHLISGRKRTEKNKDIKTEKGIIFEYKSGIGMARKLED